MEALILLIVFGLGAAYFATQNTGNVHILIGSYLISNIPLYVVVIGSILFGVLISWLISVVNGFSVLLMLRRKDNAIRHSEKNIEELEQKNIELESKIAELTKENDEVEQDESSDSAKHSFGRLVAG